MTKSGEDNPNSELTKREVARLREFHNRGKSIQWLAEEFEVSESAIRKIVNGKTWRSSHSAQFSKYPITIRALQVLDELPANKTMRREEIAEVLGCSITSTYQPFSILSSNELVTQFKGDWRITTAGSRALKDTSMIGFSLEKGQTNRRSRVFIDIDWSEVSHSQICMDAIKSPDHYVSPKNASQCLPFVLMYMRYKGTHIPKIEFEPPWSNEERTIKAFDAFKKIFYELE